MNFIAFLVWVFMQNSYFGWNLIPQSLPELAAHAFTIFLFFQLPGGRKR